MPLPIADYALIGDLHTAALVGRDGSIDWLCLPRFDSPACFAALLGDESNGHWRIAPAQGGGCDQRSYRRHSLILVSEWVTPTGTVRVIDTMPPREGSASVVRVVEGVSGTVSMEMRLVLRFDYGSIVPWVRRVDGALEAVAGPDAVWLRTPVTVRGEDLTSVARFDVRQGQRIPFVLSHYPSHAGSPREVEAEQALENSQSFWDEWISHSRASGRWATEARQSLVVIKALTYAPTGGVVAAATTSLPEQLGGPRNWDYRFCWLRDSTFTLRALLESGYTAEAQAWRDWLLRAVAGDPAKLQIMYGVDGARRLPEYELGWLPGYQASHPVRVGNAAAQQLQLDVWGEVLDSMHLARESGIPRLHHAWSIEIALLDFLEGSWQLPDNGIWEARGPRRDFVHSKVMAWAGLDRAVQAVERFGLSGPVDRWRAARDQIHREVCARGYDPERETFTQFYGSMGLDAALLQIPRVGFLPHRDPRVASTVRAIERELTHDGFVLRYDPGADGDVDGLPGAEGTFLACSFWMVDALCGIGAVDEARHLFERLLVLRNDVGLLSEEFDTTTGQQLGNTPQAFSHVGLINSAQVLTRAQAASPPIH